MRHVRMSNEEKSDKKYNWRKKQMNKCDICGNRYFASLENK